MNKLIQLSIVNAIYFSVASFIVVWLAGFLYEFLQKTTGRIELGLIIIIVLSIIILMFFFSLTNLFLNENVHKNTGLMDRLGAVMVFLLVSIIILVGLGVLFWLPF
jgi:hypothetical protein